jgi:hypothetical protein
MLFIGQKSDKGNDIPFDLLFNAFSRWKGIPIAFYVVKLDATLFNPKETQLFLTQR